MASARAPAYIGGLGMEPVVGFRSGGQTPGRGGGSEAESSVAFEAPAEEPNLAPVTVFTEIWRG